MKIEAPSGLSTLSPAIAPKAPTVGEPSFGSVLAQSIHKVDQLQREAEAASKQLAAGDQKDIHQTMIAIEKADIAMNLMLQVRNKLLTAFDDVRRMQI
jgi:flagellar hook-basal body complex protein FliE